MLAIVRCVCVCYDDSFYLNRHLTKRPSVSIVIILSLLILTPAIIWPFVMYYSSNATGRAFHLKYSNIESTFMAFQDISRDEEETRSVIFIALICVHILQFIITILLYLKILSTAYMSTTRVAIRPALEQGMVRQTHDAENTNEHLKEQRNDRKHGMKNDPGINSKCHARSQAGNNYSNQQKHYHGSERNSTKNEELRLGRKSYNSKGEILSDNTFAACAIGPRKKLESLEMKCNLDERSTRKPDQSKKQNRFFEFTNSKGEKKIVQPKIGDHVINIPLTNNIICVSRTDIICTIGLSCQLLSLIATFILTIFAFQKSGKILTINELFTGYYCFEIALFINSVVDPIVSVIFSASFRNALKGVIFPRRR